MTTDRGMKSFGSRSRVNHDSSRFYDRAMYDRPAVLDDQAPDPLDVPAQDNDPDSDLHFAAEIPSANGVIDQVVLGDATNLDFIPDSTIHLMVTSPPYNDGKDYDLDLTLDQWVKFMGDVMAETYRVLVNGGRMAINVAGMGRRPYIPLHHYVAAQAMKIGFLMRGEIIWDKGASAGGSTAWGTFRSPMNPVLRDVHEYILVFSKGEYHRAATIKDHRTTVKDDFLTATKSVWEMQTERAKKVGHPSPFPLELPRRLIELYTWPGDVVLDPLCGAATTCLAAKLAGRHWIGVDNDPGYVVKGIMRVAGATRGS